MPGGGASRFDPAVGRRLRGLREARGLSLSGLARAAGIGKATLSGLENGTRNPTLETMYAIAAALSVPISALTLDPGAPASMATPVRGAAVVSTLLEVFHEPATTYEYLRIRVLPGVEQTSPAHPTGVTEHLTVYKGHLVAGPVDAPLSGGPGAYLTWAADVPHTYRAVGPDEVEAALVIRTPRTG
jgi:XRE family transcriptional regulator, regulator of sulfur utilization